jgi:hypothetical protein
MLARATKTILQGNDRLYIKLHPRDNWETTLFLREMLAEERDRVHVSDFRDDAPIPAEVLCADPSPVAVYSVSSTAILSFYLKDIPVFLLDCGTDHFKHFALTTCCPDLKLPSLSFSCTDLCIAPEREIAFNNIRKVNRNKSYRRKIIFGLGKKGKDIIGAIDAYYGNDKDLSIDLIIDDSGTYDGFRRWPVCRPDCVTWKHGDVVLLATDTYQTLFRQRLKDLNCTADIIELL